MIPKMGESAFHEGSCSPQCAQPAKIVFARNFLSAFDKFTYNSGSNDSVTYNVNRDQLDGRLCYSQAVEQFSLS